jgi:hypothetical protein
MVKKLDRKIESNHAASTSTRKRGEKSFREIRSLKKTNPKRPIEV